jgi:hypothetical protein
MPAPLHCTRWSILSEYGLSDRALVIISIRDASAFDDGGNFPAFLDKKSRMASNKPPPCLDIGKPGQWVEGCQAGLL